MFVAKGWIWMLCRLVMTSDCQLNGVSWPQQGGFYAEFAVNRRQPPNIDQAGFLNAIPIFVYRATSRSEKVGKTNDH